MSVARQMDKKIAIHIHNEIFKKNTFELVLMRWIKLGPIIPIEVSQKEKTPIQYINEYIWNLETTTLYVRQ